MRHLLPILCVALSGCATDTREDRAPTPAHAELDVRLLRLENARLRGRLKIRGEQLAVSRANERQLLEMIGKELGYDGAPDFPSRPTVPAINATIAGLFERSAVLDAGLSSGIESGLRFTVYRDQTYVGALVVDDCDEDRATGHFLFLAPGQTPRAGDLAATRLD